MMWYQVCRASEACGDAQRARSASERALKHALDLRGRERLEADELFWAAMAARLVKDDDSFQSIRTALRSMTIPFPSNQFLQAASVAGDKDLLRKIARKPAEQNRAWNVG